VFMEVFDCGVLLTGKSSIGKSELALELIHRGHRLIADDAPVFSRMSPESLVGHCPLVLQDFLEVRGLGILNVRKLFGNIAIKDCKKLHLIVQIVNLNDIPPESIDRLQGMHRNRDVLNVSIPEVSLPTAPGRNLSVLVETAVRNQVLKLNGYDAVRAFQHRQHSELINEEKS